ncbi:MAG: sensor histidine kinase [Cyanobacteria bacterium J06635_15]
MSRPITYQNHPFPFLLYLEWALLAMAVLNQLAPASIPHRMHFPLLGPLSILGYGALGLYLPRGSLIQRIGHVTLQLVLITAASGFGFGGLRLFPFLYLYLILVIRSCFLFSMPGRLAVTGLAFMLSFGSFQLRIQDIGARVPPPIRRVLGSFHINFLILFFLSLAFVLLLVNALLSERASQDKLRRANQQLRASAAQIEQLAMAQERSRIARDIHDSVGHSLTALNIQLEGAIKLWKNDPEKARQFLAEAKTLGSTALQDVRQSVATLRQNPIAGKRLEEAIASLAEQVQHSIGVRPEINILLPSTLSDALKTTLYRIVQEALTNITKHAEASEIHISMQTQSNHIRLDIEDNGRGFQPGQTTSGFGLQGMRERAQAAGGRFYLDSSPGSGCHIRVEVPLNANERSDA